MFSAGDIIEVISKEAGDWWKGRLGTKQGIFPANYVTPAVQKQVCGKLYVRTLYVFGTAESVPI